MSESTGAGGGLYTIGYAHLELGAFLAILGAHGVETVVDVRLTPRSRRRGFSKSTLATALAAEGIGYLHEPLLGNPPDNRAAFSSLTPERGRARMRALLESHQGVVASLAARARRERVALLCVEESDARCHRQVIAERLCELEPSLTLTQLH